MDGVIRYIAGDALTESTRKARAGFDPGFWVQAADFDEREARAKQLEVALQDRLTAVEQRNAELVAAARNVLQAYDSGDASDALDSLAATLNPNPEAESHEKH